MNAILEGLNEEQSKAVQCTEGPVLIVAGAGSGKTRVLTSRIAYVLDTQKVQPSEILALTFTKKAATEMKERIALMVGPGRARRLVMGTFHAIFVRFLREFAGSLGYPEQFTIYDQSDSTSAVKAIIKDLQLDDKIYKPREVLARISSAKNNLMLPDAYLANPQIQISDSHSKKPRIGEIYKLYQQRMKQSGVMDFDDILVNMNILLRDNKAALESIAARFRYIMVDEYQDTNFSQYVIIKKLSAGHRNICVVGDDSQSIYAFRGARIENILKFKEDYPEAKTFRLERNYRSTKTIVDAANSVIEHNEGRIPKKCYAVGPEGEKIHVIKTYSEGEEAAMIVSEIIQRMQNAKAQYQDFAILYRTNAQSRALEEQLRRRNIPYMIYSGNSFFERAEVKDMMAYFKLAVNPLDDESFKRVVNKPARAIGDTTVTALADFASKHDSSLFKACWNEELLTSGIRPAAVEKLRLFCRMIDGFASSVKTTDAFALANRIAEESGLLRLFKEDTSIEGMSRTANIEELINSVEAFIEERTEESEGEQDLVTLDDFLENTMLLSAVDVTDDEDTNNKVSLMTVHSSKGLEYPYVFIAGLEENLFPSGGMLAAKSDIEEERRLFYVAVTRAKKGLALSFAGSRMRNGKHESNAPSRFLKEIDSQYLDMVLDDDDFSDEGVRHEWGGFGSRFTGGRMDRFGSASSYGQSGKVTYEHRGTSSLDHATPGNCTSFGRGSSGGNAAPGNHATLGIVRGGTMQRSGMVGPERSGGISGGSIAAGTLATHQGVSRTYTTAEHRKPDLIDPNFVPADPREFREGERIEHNRFGAGTIKTITGVYPEMKAVINFDDFGEKLLLLKYAKMRHLK